MNLNKCKLYSKEYIALVNEEKKQVKTLKAGFFPSRTCQIYAFIATRGFIYKFPLDNFQSHNIDNFQPAKYW